MRSALLFTLALFIASPARAQGPVSVSDEDDPAEATACDQLGADALRRRSLSEALVAFEAAHRHAARRDPCRAAVCLYFTGRTHHLLGDRVAAERAYQQHQRESHPDHAAEQRLRRLTDRRLRELHAARPRRWLWVAVGATSAALVGSALGVGLYMRESHIYP